MVLVIVFKQTPVVARCDSQLLGALGGSHVPCSAKLLLRALPTSLGDQLDRGLRR